MASLLRSSKFLRSCAGFARNFVFSQSRGDIDGSFINSSQYLTSRLSKGLATRPAVSNVQSEINLDRSIRQLDTDVRRTGRISRKELEDVLEELRHAGSASSTQSLLIIRCCGNLVPEETPDIRTHLVNEIWNTLEKIGVPMDISHYNALLRVYLENEHQFSPTEFLSNLEEKGIEPNRVTYQRLISRYCQQGDIEGATRILEFMREKQLPVNEGVFNALIMGHSQADDMESAAAILGVMQQAALEPSSETYTTLLCGYAKRGDMDSIKKILIECEEKNIFLMDKDYMEVIYVLAVNNHDVLIDDIINKMQQLAGYNQDAVNLILRLINKGRDDIGMKIMRTMPQPVMPDGQPSMSGNFFIRQLVRVNRPVEKILSFCRELEETGLNSKALIYATEMSLQAGNVDQACSLLSYLKEDGFPIRPHYFWPLLVACGKRNDTEGILDVLRKMNLQFGLTLGGDTLRDYAIPAMKGHSAEQIVGNLIASGVRPAAAASSMVFNLLLKDKLAEAADLASRYRAYYAPAVLRRPLVQAFYKTKDVESYLKMVHLIYDGLDRARDAPASAEEENVSSNALDKAEIIGQMIIDVALTFRDNRTVVIKDVLQGLVNHGLSISNSAAELLQEKLSGEELTNEVSSLLSKLTTGELTPTTIRKSTTLSQVSLDEQQLKELIKTLEAKEQPANNVKRQLLTLYCREKELEKAEQFKQELESQGFVITAGVCAQLIDLYCSHEKLTEALDCLNHVIEKYPDFAIGNMRILKLAGLLVKHDKLQDAVKYLQELVRESVPSEMEFVHRATAWRMLNTLAEKGNTDDIKMLLEVLEKNEYVKINNVLLGPLIKSFLVRDDIPGAIACFEWCAEQYSCTPWKKELACRLIQAENADMLQRLTDLSTKVHGEVNSLYDLVFAFVDCGRIRAARKILETPGLRSRPQRLMLACERYRQEGQITSLEGLIEVTRDLSYIDRSDIFYQLLLSYCNNDDVDKALGLWTRMQEEDVQPTDEFLSALGTLLEKNGKKVPFVIPQVIPKPTKSKVEVERSDKMPAENRIASEFRKALIQDDVDKALEIKRRVQDTHSQKLSVTSLSTLVEKLLQSGRQGEALKIALDMLEDGTHPIPSIFKFLLNKLTEAGDVESMERIGNFLSEEIKKVVSFDNKLCIAYCEAGKAKEYIENLEKLLDNEGSDLSSLDKQFPRGGALGILEKQDDLLPLYEKVARKYASHGIIAPINVLWIHMFIKNDIAAKKLWDEFLDKYPRLMFHRILDIARKDNDLSILQRLLEYVKDSPVTERSIGIIHSCKIDILVRQGRHEEALDALNETLSNVSLENINRSTLLRLKTNAEAAGKEFPYRIPEKKEKSSSSSSSSDDEMPEQQKH